MGRIGAAFVALASFGVTQRVRLLNIQTPDDSGKYKISQFLWSSPFANVKNELFNL
jgi:hypothetical protein